MNLQDNIVAKLAYKSKFYIGIARGQIGWFTSWLPEIVSLGILLHFLGFDFTKQQILLFIPIVLILLTLFGYIWYKIGLYKVEIMTNVIKDPYQSEVLKAVRKINGGEYYETTKERKKS